MTKYPKKYFLRIRDLHNGDLLTVKQFKNSCKTGMFVDSDGYGHPVKRKMLDPRVYINPSKVRSIPKDATHIMWYNK